MLNNEVLNTILFIAENISNVYTSSLIIEVLRRSLKLHLTIWVYLILNYQVL